MNDLHQLIDEFNRVDLGAGRANLLIGAALVLLLVLIRLARRFKRFGAARLGTIAVVVIVVGTTIEGAIDLARGSLDAHGVEVLFPAVVFEAIAAKIYDKARRYAKEHGHPGRYGYWLIAIGVVAGVVVGSAGDSVPEKLFRFVLPMLAVWLLWLDLTPDGVRRARAADATTWRWTPRRLAIWLGVIEPGQRDAETINRDHLIRRMANLRWRLQSGPGWLRTRRRTRLQALALKVDDDSILDAVRARVTRAYQIEVLTGPATAADTAADARPDTTADTDDTESAPGVSAEMSAPVSESLSAAVGNRPDTPTDGAGPESSPIVRAERGEDAGNAADTASGPEQRKRPVRRSLTTGERVAQMRRRNPAITVAEMAKRLGKDPRTIRRYLPPPEGTAPVAPTAPVEHANGEPVPALLGPEVTT